MDRIARNSDPELFLNRNTSKENFISLARNLTRFSTRHPPLSHINEFRMCYWNRRGSTIILFRLTVFFR